MEQYNSTYSNTKPEASSEKMLKIVDRIRDKYLIQLNNLGIPNWAMKQFCDEILFGIPNFYIKTEDGVVMVKKPDVEPNLEDI